MSQLEENRSGLNSRLDSGLVLRWEGLTHAHWTRGTPGQIIGLSGWYFRHWIRPGWQTASDGQGIKWGWLRGKRGNISIYQPARICLKFEMFFSKKKRIFPFVNLSHPPDGGAPCPTFSLSFFSSLRDNSAAGWRLINQSWTKVIRFASSDAILQTNHLCHTYNATGEAQSWNMRQKHAHNSQPIRILHW